MNEAQAQNKQVPTKEERIIDKYKNICLKKGLKEEEEGKRKDERRKRREQKKKKNKDFEESGFGREKGEQKQL